MTGGPEDTRPDRGPGTGMPKKLGRFETLRHLGHGGMGTVYLAEDKVIGRQVAIKEIRVQEGVSEADLAEQRVRFQVELRAAGQLSHANIATVYDAFECEGAHCIALEYVPGVSLDKRLKQEPPLTANEIVELAGQIAAGLDYAHRRGVVHRDVKPGNVLLSDEGAVKITDFGVAKLVSMDVTQTGIALGTPAYMSPEQIQGKPLDGRSDQFSLGVMLYQMLTGRRPFGGESTHAMLYQILHAEPERPVAVNGALPPAVDRVLLRALSKEPQERYPTCTALARDLAAAVAGALAAAGTAETFRYPVKPGASTPPPPPAPPTVPPPRSESTAVTPEKKKSFLPWVLGCLGAILLLLAGSCALLFLVDWDKLASDSPATSEPSPVTAPLTSDEGIATDSAPDSDVNSEPVPSEEPEAPEDNGADFQPPAGAEAVEVEITSEPGRCRVTIDGRHAGFTPLTKTLEPGPHQFTCNWPGQGRRSLEDTISPDRRRLHFQL